MRFPGSLDRGSCSKQPASSTRDSTRLHLSSVPVSFCNSFLFPSSFLPECCAFRRPTIPNLSHTTATGLCPKQIPVQLKSMNFLLLASMELGIVLRYQEGASKLQFSVWLIIASTSKGTRGVRHSTEIDFSCSQISPPLGAFENVLYANSTSVVVFYSMAL